MHASWHVNLVTYHLNHCLHLFLCRSGTSLADSDVIVLAPPMSILVTEGDAVSLPCVGSRGTAPSFSLDGVAQTSSSRYSLDLNHITASDDGTYTCQIGVTTADVDVNVSTLSECLLNVNLNVTCAFYGR